MAARFYIPRPLRNKFVLSALAFVLWLMFFDNDDMFTQQERRSMLHQIQQSKQYYEEQILAERKFAEDLKNNPAAIEKFAREAYGMKRANEDLYVVQPVQQEK